MRNPLLLKLLTAATSVALVLLVAEIGLRILAEEPWYERLPTLQQREPFSFVEVGEQKFPLRRSPLGLPKIQGTQRILLLGDSFTYGTGVKDQFTWASLLAKQLNAVPAASGGTFFEVFNGGLPASFTSDWVELFDEMASDFEPDFVVAVFFLRDGVAGVTSMGQVNAIRESMRALSKQSRLYRFSRLYRLVVERRAQQAFSRRYLGRLAEGYTGPPEATREWQVAKGNLRYLRDKSSRLGAKFVIVIFPVLFELQGNYPLMEAIEEITRFTEAEEIETLSLLPAFAGRAAADLWVAPLDQHPNEEGHAIAARAISGFLLEQFTGGGETPSPVDRSN